MNYWVTPTGRVFESEEVGFHIRFCDDYIDDHDMVDTVLDWIKSRPNYNSNYVDYFQEVLHWVRYCDWGIKPSWVVRTKLTKKQKERIFELTGDWFE